MSIYIRLGRSSVPIIPNFHVRPKGLHNNEIRTHKFNIRAPSKFQKSTLLADVWTAPP